MLQAQGSSACCCELCLGPAASGVPVPVPSRELARGFGSGHLEVLCSGQDDLGALAVLCCPRVGTAVSPSSPGGFRRDRKCALCHPEPMGNGSPGEWESLHWSRGLKHLLRAAVPLLPFRTKTEWRLKIAGGAASKAKQSLGRGRIFGARLQYWRQETSCPAPHAAAVQLGDESWDPTGKEREAAPGQW